MYGEFQTSSTEEVVIKLLGKISLNFEEFADLQNQIKLRPIIEEVLYNYDIRTKETALVASDIEEKAQLFLAVKKLDGLSPKTLYNYERVLLQFSQFFKKPVGTITTMDIRMFLAAKGQTIKASSLNAVTFALKSFFNWLFGEEYILKNPMLKIKSTKTPKRIRKALTVEELEKVKQACKIPLEKSLIEFIASTGARVSEVESVNISDLDYNTNSLRVIGKGNKERVIYFSVKAKLLLLEYLNSRKDTKEALFVTRKYPYSRLGRRSIEKIVGDVAKRAGIEKAVFPHLLRHSFASHALNSGMNPAVLQRLMGHEDFATTQIYAQLSEENVKHEYGRIN